MGTVIFFPKRPGTKSPVADVKKPTAASGGSVEGIELEPSDELVDAYINKRLHEATRIFDADLAHLNDKIRSSSAALQEHARKCKPG